MRGKVSTSKERKKPLSWPEIGVNFVEYCYMYVAIASILNDGEGLVTHRLLSLQISLNSGNLKSPRWRKVNMFTVTFYFQLFSLLNFLAINHFVCHLCTNDDHIFWLSTFGSQISLFACKDTICALYSILSMSPMNACNNLIFQPERRVKFVLILKRVLSSHV